MCFVYIPKSQDGKYYVGSTSDLDKRVKHHKGGFTHSTRRMKNPEVVLTQEYKTMADARSVERKIKRLKRKDYIEKMVQEGKIALVP